jgi:hypothetical protein
MSTPCSSSTNISQINSNLNINNNNNGAASSASNLTNTNNNTNDDESTPFLVVVTNESFEVQNDKNNEKNETIRLDAAAGAAPFFIKQMGFVSATIVDKASKTLDLVELIFKEQYLNGYDMLRIKSHMVRPFFLVHE